MTENTAFETANAVVDKLIEKEKQSEFCHRIVQFGRDTCTARAPKCGECPLAPLCEHFRKAEGKKD